MSTFVNGLDDYNSQRIALVIRSDLIKVADTILNSTEATYLFLLVLLVIIFSVNMVIVSQVIATNIRTTINKSALEGNPGKKTIKRFNYALKRPSFLKKKQRKEETQILMDNIAEINVDTDSEIEI